MHEFFITLAIGGTVMMSMFAAAYAAKFEALRGSENIGAEVGAFDDFR